MPSFSISVEVEVGGGDLRALAHDHRALDAILQLAVIPSQGWRSIARSACRVKAEVFRF